jgi:hypothetical protein
MTSKTDSTAEEWRDIKGYEGYYQVSSAGRIASTHRDRLILKQRTNRTGYLVVGLHINGLSSTKQVHRLVGLAFITNKHNKSQINHKDGVKSNNSVHNLEWMTARENSLHAVDVLGCGKTRKSVAGYKGVGRAVVQKTAGGEFLAIFKTCLYAGEVSGISPTTIGRRCRGEREQSGEYIWEYMK